MVRRSLILPLIQYDGRKQPLKTGLHSRSGSTNPLRSIFQTGAAIPKETSIAPSKYLVLPAASAFSITMPMRKKRFSTSRINTKQYPTEETARQVLEGMAELKAIQIPEAKK